MGTVLRGAGYAIGEAGAVLRLHLIGSVVYLVLFVLLTSLFGLIGPGLAAALGALIPFGGLVVLVQDALRTQHGTRQ